MNATPAPIDLAPRMSSGQPVRRRLRWGLLCLLLGSGCAADRTTIEVEVAGLIGQEKQLLLDATLDGRMLDVAPPPFTLIVRHCPLGAEGSATMPASTYLGMPSPKTRCQRSGQLS